MEFRKIVVCVVLSFLLIVLVFWNIRFFGLREVDDVHPGFECSDDILEKSDVLWIVPNFNGNSILDEEGWCEKIKEMNKSLGMHGVEHSFEVYC